MRLAEVFQEFMTGMNTDQLSPYLRHDDITVTVEDGKGGPSYAEIIDDAGIMAAVKYKLV